MLVGLVTITNIRKTVFRDFESFIMGGYTYMHVPIPTLKVQALKSQIPRVVKRGLQR